MGDDGINLIFAASLKLAQAGQLVETLTIERRALLQETLVR